MKLASIIDYIRDELDKDIWSIDGKDVKLQPHVKEQIEDVVFSMLDDIDLPDEALKGLFIYGSILSNQYNPKTDVDCRVLLDPEIVHKKFSKEITGDIIFDLVIEQVHDIPIGHTKHPLNCSIVIEGEDTELGRSELGKTEEDPVYDVLNDKIVVPPVYKDYYDPDEEFAEEREEADVIMGKLDEMLRELKTDCIDYNWLEDAVKDVKDKDKLIGKLESKLEEIESDIAALVEEYGDIKDMRTEEYGEEGDRHKGPGNVRFKMIEKYQYMDLLRKLKRIFKGGVTEKEVEDVAETLNVSGHLNRIIKYIANFIINSDEKMPPKNKINNLIKAYMLMKYSGLLNAPIKLQQKFNDTFYQLHNKIENEYPHIDMSSTTFYNQLEEKADNLWNSKAMHGPGVDW